jgi:parvulin-like peptidyl-prolyl isomerase
MSKSRSASGAPPTRKHLARAAREKRQRQYILIATAIVSVLVIGIIGFGVYDQAVLRPREAVARVGDQNVTRGDFINFARYQRLQLVLQYQRIAQAMQFFSGDPQSTAYFQQQQQQISSQLSDSATLGRNVIDSLIDDILIRKEAARRGITVSPAEVDQAFKAFYAFYPNGTPTPTATPTTAATGVPPTIDATVVARLTAAPSLTPSATFTPTATATITPTQTPGPSATATATQAPSATPTPYSTQGFATVVSLYESTVKTQTGISDSDLRHLVEGQLYREKLQTALQAEVPTSADEVHARHIQVADLATALTIEQNLSSGGDFVALAARYSTDTSTKDNAGDLGWFAKGEQDPAIDTVAFTQTIGVYSAPIAAQSGAGYHIIRVIERGQHALSASALASKRASALQDWLDSQRAVTMPDGRTLVQINDNWQTDVPISPDIAPTP